MRIHRCVKRTLILAAAVPLAAAPAHAADYVTSVLATNPVAYFRLNAANQPSLVGGYTTGWDNGVAVGGGAPLVGSPGNTGAAFDGVNDSAPGIITTSLTGNSPGRGTIISWVNLSALPSATSAIKYVAGESQSGNDLDLQFESDNQLRFYTGAGENTAYAPDVTTLVGNWHMIAATYDGTLGASSFRNIYWDGALGQGFTGGVNGAAKTAGFTIGYSPVFTGREFTGGIDEVAFYDRALSAEEVSSLYAARLNAAEVPAVPEPATWAMMVSGFGVVGTAMRRKRRQAVTA